jgi:hypothetical protein
VEPDQHPGPEQGTGRAPDPGGGRSDEQPEAREAAAAGSESEGAVTQPGAPELDPNARTDMIMSKLPRTRPQRVTGRRHREQARQAPRSSPEAPGLLREEGSPTPRGGKRPTPQRRTAARPKSRTDTTPSGRPARRTAAEVPVTQAAKPRDPGRPRAKTGSAPGLPRLAVDGAVEAVKLPLRVGGRLTLRALDAAARSLRGR